MRSSVAINYLFLSVFVLEFLTLSAVAFSNEDMKYSKLNEIWIEEMLSKNPVRDPRSDSAQLRPVLNYDGEIIQVHSFEKKQKGMLVGEGWQLV